MGEANRKNKLPLLTDAERTQALAGDPFATAYDAIFKLVKDAYTSFGEVPHQLIGVQFKNGSPSQMNGLLIHRTEDVPHLRHDMLLRWPMVIHVCEAWSAPDESCAPHAHPERQDVVMIMLNTRDQVGSATCLVNPAQRTIERASLIMPNQLGGRLGRKLPDRPKPH